MNVLVADDEPTSRHLLQTFLRKWGYTVAVAVDGLEAVHLIDQPDGPKLVVLDRIMLGMDGLEVSRHIRKQAREPYIYIILLTAQGKQQEIIEGFEAGADDYITKPFEAAELKARVQTGARIVDLQQQLIAAREQMRAEAMYDSLTGLLSRRAFFAVFDAEVTRAKRQGTQLSLIMADLDHFKSINDQYGHQAGDIVLCETARRIMAATRGADVVGRFGGEEFVVTAPDCSLADATVMAERIRNDICAQPIELAQGSVLVTMSLGVASTSNMDESSQLLRIADEALYRAKHGGRNTVRVAVSG